MMTPTFAEDGECIAQVCHDIVSANVVGQTKTSSNASSPDISDAVNNCFSTGQESKGCIEGQFCTSCLQPCNEPCEDTTKQSLAVGRCVTCSSLLCRSCVFAHKFMLCFQGHNVVPLDVSADRVNSVNSDAKPDTNPVEPVSTHHGDDSSLDQYPFHVVAPEGGFDGDHECCLVRMAAISQGGSQLVDERDPANRRMRPFQQKDQNPVCSYKEDPDRSSANGSPLSNLLANLYFGETNDSSGMAVEAHPISAQQKYPSIRFTTAHHQPTFQTASNMRGSCIEMLDSNSLSTDSKCTDMSDVSLAKRNNVGQPAFHPVVSPNTNIQLTDQAAREGANKRSFQTASDLLLFLDKTGAALQAQHWKTSLRINEGFEFFKDELCQRRQILMKVLDEAFEKEHKKLSKLANEIHNGAATSTVQDLSSKVDLLRSCEQIVTQNTPIFEFVTDCATIKRAVLNGCGQLRIRQLQDAEEDKSSPWNSSDSHSLSSGYFSLNHPSQQVSSFAYPTNSGQFQAMDEEYGRRQHAAGANTTTGIMGSAAGIQLPDYSSLAPTSGMRSDILSQWSALSSDSGCYWLQDPCWSNTSDSYSLFSGVTNSFQQNPTGRKHRLSDLIDPSLGKANPLADLDELSGHPTARYVDVARSTAGQLCDSSAGCCCGNRPLSNVRRQKMVYHCKFGEFGGLDGQFTEPSGIAVNMQSDIIVADTNNHRIQVFSQDGHYKFRFGECGKRDGQLLYPNRVAVFKLSGDIVVTERSPTHQVQIFNQNGTFVRKFGSTVLQHPRGVCVDPSGNIIVAECKVMRVFVFDRFGNAISRFNCSKHLEFPNSVCANDKQEIFISDNRAHCVKVFSYDGRLIRTLGGEGITNFPIGVALDSSGNVLVADNHNNFNLTLFSQTGQLLAALESKVKHAQCFDASIMDSSGSVVLSSKDYHIYVYRYMPVAYFPNAPGMNDL